MPLFSAGGGLRNEAADEVARGLEYQTSEGRWGACAFGGDYESSSNGSPTLAPEVRATSR